MSHYKDSLYSRWRAMKQRCNDPNHTAYYRYGGRGIKVCEEWLNSFSAYRDWALSHGYRPGLQLDRIDNDGNYEPSNCRWATVKEQAYNRKSNRYLTVYGITHSAYEWTNILGHKHHQLILLRIKRGWSVEDAVCTPPNGRKDIKWHEEFKRKIKEGVIA